MKTALLYVLIFPSGKIYIGVTTGTVENRIIRHVSHSKSRDYAVHRAIRKYGRESIVARTLAVGPRDYILDLEQRAIAAFGAFVPDGYNQSLGGEGIRIPIFTAEHRAKLSAAKKGRPSPRKGRPGKRHTVESKARISAAGMGRVFSAEARAKIGASKIGNKNCLGRVVSAETRQKISDAQRGIPRPDGVGAKVSAALKGKPWSQRRRDAQRI